MIQREDLQKLIEKESTIYELYDNKRVIKIQLKKDFFILNEALYEKVPEGKSFGWWYLSTLYKTRELALWHKRFDYVFRTERLDLPDWELVSSNPELRYFAEFYSFDPDSDTMFKYILDKNIEKNTLIITCQEWGEDAVDIIWEEDFTEENYTLACQELENYYVRY